MEREVCPSGYSSSASARAVREEGLQCTGLRPLPGVGPTGMGGGGEGGTAGLNGARCDAGNTRSATAALHGSRKAPGPALPAHAHPRAAPLLALHQRPLGAPAAPQSLPVDVAVEHHLPKHAQLGSFIGRLQGDIGSIPVGPHAVPARGQAFGVGGERSAWPTWRVSPAWGQEGGRGEQDPLPVVSVGKSIANPRHSTCGDKSPFPSRSAQPTAGIAPAARPPS